MSNSIVEESRALVAEISKRRSTSSLTGEVDADVAKFILTVSTSRRFSLISTPELLTTLWAEIRSNRAVTDFVLESSIELLLRLGNKDYDDLANTIAFAYSANSAPGFSVLDDDLVRRIPNANASVPFSKYIQGNPWYVFLVLLETLDVSAPRSRVPSKP